MSYRANGETNR